MPSKTSQPGPRALRFACSREGGYAPAAIAGCRTRLPPSTALGVNPGWRGAPPGIRADPGIMPHGLTTDCPRTPARAHGRERRAMPTVSTSPARWISGTETDRARNQWTVEPPPIVFGATESGRTYCWSEERGYDNIAGPWTVRRHSHQKDEGPPTARSLVTTHVGATPTTAVEGRASPSLAKPPIAATQMRPLSADQFRIHQRPTGYVIADASMSCCPGRE
jgi:hypothetical protein